MLVLTRTPGQEVLIGDSIRVVVVSVDGKKIRLGFQAPEQVPILRGEIRNGPRGAGAVTNGRVVPRKRPAS